MPGSSGPTDRVAGPMLLTDPAMVWLVEQGSADVFLVPLREGEAVGVRHHLLRVPQGDVLFGGAARDGYALLTVPTPDSRQHGTAQR